MKEAPASRRNWPILELAGMFVCGAGLCFALAFTGLSYSEERLAKEKQQLTAKMSEMKTALAAAKIPEEQIPGLLRVHKAALVSDSIHEHFIILSFFFLLSLLVASLGLTLLLWAKLRAFQQADRIAPD